VRTREAQFVRDVGGDPDFLEALPGARSEICVPLLKDRTVLGTLNVESEQEGALTEADVFLLTTLAGQVTVAIENARLFRAEREQRELAEALRDASSALSDSLDIDIIMDRLLLLIERVVPYDMANLLLYDPAQGRVHATRQRGVEAFGAPVAAQMSTLSLDVRTTANLERMLETRRSHIIPDTAQDPHWIPVAATPFVRSWLGAPIVTQGEVIGFFSLDKCEAGYYQPEHAERLSAFAGQAALVMQNARLFEVQQKRAEEQRLLWHASQDFTAGLSQEAVLQAVVAHMTTAVQTARCTVSLWERTKDAVVTLQDYAPDRPDDVVPLGTPYALADYPATRAVLETRRPQIVRTDDPDADAAEVALLRHNGHASVMMLPLDTGEQVFGLVELFRDADMLSFAETDVQLARSLAAQAAVALENSRLHMALQDNLHELDALLKANQALLSTLELDPLLDNILAAAVGAIPAAEKGRITLIDASGERLAVRAVHGYADPRVKALVQARHQGFAARVIRDNAPLLLADTHAEPGAWHHGGLPELNRVRSSVMAPLAAKGPGSSAFGVISVESSRPGAFGDRDLRVLGAFANTAAVAIDNARLHAEVQRLAVTDSLTGLANPRAFEHALVTEFSRAQRYGYALSLVIMDIDSFKVYNDTFGHPAGNERLKAIAEVLRESVREPDLPVRYGGEEFALLLPHTAKAGAEVLAERVREAAEQSAPRRPRKGDPVPGYTLSLGVATFPEDAMTADDLVVAADYAELAAKRAGKNRVCVAEPLPPAAEPLPAASD
jgi:diguanylate cyclase (GGDEF)-like protein